MSRNNQPISDEAHTIHCLNEKLPDLRDLFAIAALHALIGVLGTKIADGPEVMVNACAGAYQLADIAMAAKEKPTKQTVV